MTQVKELHVGKRMEDLEPLVVIPEVKTRKIQMLLETARKLYKEAEKYNRDGDEELAYVFYMKYFNLLNCIHKKPDYSQHKQTVRQMLGNNAMNMETMDKLEILTKSLNERYNQLQELMRQQIEQREYNELSASEKFDRVKASSVTAEGDFELPLKSLSVIDCAELFERTKEQNVLIMDCRSSSDYKTSHLTYNWSFNVPEENVLPGMSAGKLRDKLDEQSRVLWSARSVKDYVVLMDWNSTDSSSNSKIVVLMDILKKWDPDVSYRSPIKILKGGYEYFIMMYPTLCTNPAVRAPQPSNVNTDSLDDIEYPSIHDITMKDEIRERDSTQISNSSLTRLLSLKQLINRPSVDRSSKLLAMKTYNEKAQNLGDILKEQEMLLQKAQSNDHELKEATKKFKTIFKNKHTTVVKDDFTSDEREIIYNIMQLESAADDYKIEINQSLDELEKYKLLGKEEQQQQQLTHNQAESLEETKKKIETKIQERQKLNEQFEREKEERQLQLAIARENKRHMKPPVIEDEDISKPKIPQFDRSVKPSQTIAIQPVALVERHRDFSPVPGTVGRGLTGLKNLGNTCYMNSILQCLSNTPQLTEYCVSDRYKKYISRTNKTKGEIVEEVAALIKVLWNGQYKCVATRDLRYAIGQYQKIFRGVEQQDSHEFLTILMDWLHSDLQTLSVPTESRSNITASEKAWVDFTKSKESLILHLFYGQIKSTVKCVECNQESATYECFSNLSLELPSNSNICYLSQCMDMYFSGELIHGWNCPNCKQKRDAVKKLDISKLPPVLVVHFKRFYADTDALGNSYKKKQNYVRFPLENLDMTPHIAKAQLRYPTPKTYQLYGVSNHYGSMESGHYTAFCKNGNYGRWFKFDDQVVTPLDTSNVVSSAAYILFYTWLPRIQMKNLINN